MDLCCSPRGGHDTSEPREMKFAMPFIGSSNGNEDDHHDVERGDVSRQKQSSRGRRGSPQQHGVKEDEDETTEDDDEDHQPGGHTQLLPILIIPGFMSSGLAVEKSKLRPDWVGKRIWLNLGSLGVSAFYFGNAQEAYKKPENYGSSASVNSLDRDHEYLEQTRYKSAWLEHMRLNENDLRSDPKGIKVRAIRGLEGIDYLTPGMFTNLVSYVFGPVITQLEKVGYQEDINLAAAPYDWRLPPSELEKRDSYFSRLLQRVEQLYKNNNSMPVVVLGHSLGCKTAHYFLNFALQKKGQKWLDTHIHTYMPVGAPHLGAPKALRSYVVGDKMSLDTFLSDEEALVLGRSFGSGPWLFPHKLPKDVPCSSFVMPHGILQISISDYAINVYNLIEKRMDHSRPNKYRLVFAFGGGGDKNNRTITTPFQTVASADRVYFKDQISFATNENPNSPGERAIQLILQEPGIAAAKHEKESSHCCNPITCILKCITCFWICDLIYKILRLITCGIFQTAVLSWDAITATAGGGTTLAFSEPIPIPAGVWKGEEAKLEIKLFHKDDYAQRGRGGFFGCLGSLQQQPRTASIRIKMKWLSYNNQMKISRSVCSAIATPDLESAPLIVTRGGSNGSSGKNKSYQEFSGNEILEREGLNHTLQFVKDVLDADKIGPRWDSAILAPPVKRVHAIYGVNLPTEIGAIYKRKDTCLKGNELKNLYVLDKKATVEKSSGYVVKNGLLMETSKTKQRNAVSAADNSSGDDDSEDESAITKSGDGTVPYWSLQHSKTWHSSTCNVSVVELPNAEHREILADTRFHKTLIAYCRRNYQ